MYAAPGVGLAAPQVGIERRIFVYDVGEGPVTVINPEIVESRGEWEYEEGCLSVPDLHWPIVRPKEVHLVGRDLQGNELSIEADELLGRVFQHELDHLDGILLLERLEKDQRKQAMRVLRARALLRLRREPAATPEPEPSGRRPVTRLAFLGTPEVAVGCPAGAARCRPRRGAGRDRTRPSSRPGQRARCRRR